MSASTPMSATDARARLRRGDEGAGSTLVRALRLSPELRLGLAGTLALALLATAGRGTRGGAPTADADADAEPPVVAAVATKDVELACL